MNCMARKNIPRHALHFQMPPHCSGTHLRMPDWVTSIYVLLTSRVPIPRMLFLFSVVTLSLFTLTSHHYSTLDQVGLVLPVMCALFGHVAVIAVKLPDSLQMFDRIGITNAGDKIILISLATYAGVMSLPSLDAAQTALSLGIAIYLGLFVLVVYMLRGGDKIGWFARDWDVGQRNAANWHIARLVALILLNETAARYGSAFDWVLAITLGPIALHYLMHWTIVVTHPHDKATPSD